MKKRYAFILIIIVLLGIFSCSENSTDPDDDNQPEFQYSEDLYIPENDSSFVDVTIAGDTLVFDFDSQPNDSDFAMGKILVGTTGNGYLRRVIEEPLVLGNSVTVITEQATIVDAVIDGSASGTAPLVISSSSLKKLDYQREVEIDDKIYTMKVRSETPTYSRTQETSNVDFTDIEIAFEIAEYNAVTIEIDSVIFSIDGDLHWKFALHDSMVDTVYLAVEQDYGVRFTGVDFTMSQTIPLGSQEIELTEIDFAPIVFTLGIFPVVIFPELEISFEASAGLTISCESSVGSNAQIEAGFTAGAEYIGGMWSPVWDKYLDGSGSVETDATESISGEITEGIQTNFSFLFYGLTGPGLYLTPYLYQEMGFPPLSMGIGAGIDGGLSYSFSILSIDLASFSYSLIDYRYPFLEWEQDRPYRPELVYPVSGTTFVDTDFDLEWNEVVVADDYNLQIATDSLFSSPEFEQDIDSTQYNAPSVLEDGIYFWRVNATGNGMTGDWSEIRVFGIGDVAPTAPELIAPDSGVSLTGVMPDLEWEELLSVNNYELQISIYEDFHQTVLDTTLSDGHFTPDSLQTEIYYWRVRGISPEGILGEWSEIWSFSTFFVQIGEMGRCELSGQPSEICVEGNLAYFVSQNALDIVDFTSPTAPSLLGTWDASSYCTDVVKYSDYLLIAGGSSEGLIVLDVSTPTVPELLSTLDIGYSGIKLDVEYPYVYINTSVGLKIVDISDVLAPNLIGEAENLNNGEKDVVAIGDMVLTGYDSYYSSFLGLHILDVSDPTDPVFIGQTLKSARAIAVNDHIAYALYSLNREDFAIVDISNPSELSGMYDGQLAEYSCTSDLKCIQYNNSRVFTGQDDPYILEVIDVSDPAEPFRMAYLNGDYQDGVRCIGITGDYILTGTTGSDCVIYEMD